MNTRRITVSLPESTADLLPASADAAGAPSVSAYVAEAVAARMARDAALGWLDRIWGPADPQTMDQARRAVSATTGAPLPAP